MKKYFKLYKDMPVQVKASFWFLICAFLQRGISMITTPVFTRILTPGEYGQYSVFSSWMSILMPVVCLNLYAGVYSQGIIKFEEDRGRYTSSLQGLVLTLVMIWTAVYLAGRTFWNGLLSLTTVQVLAMLVIIWTSASYSFWSMEQRADFKYRKIGVLILMASVLHPVVCIFLILGSEDKVSARILGMAAVNLALYAGTFISQMAKGRQFFSKKYWLYALKFNIPLLPHYLSMSVLGSSDRIMISIMEGDGKAGIYNLAYSVSTIMSMFNGALLQTIEPWIYRRLKEKRIGNLGRVAYPCFFAVAALNLLLIMFAPEIVRIFAPAEYYEAIWVIPAVALSVFFTFLYTFFATFEFYYEKTGYITGATVGGALLNIVLNFIFIRRYGYVAAGYTTLFGYIVFAVLHYFFMQKICREYMDDARPYSLWVIAGIGVGSLIVGMCIMLTYNAPVIRYGLMLATVGIAFLMRGKIRDMKKCLWG